MPRRLLALVLAAALAPALAQPIGAWTVAGSGEAIYTAVADGGLLLFCPDDVGAGPDVDVGPYGLAPGTEYELTFQADGAADLTLFARVGPATAVTVTGEDAAALVAFLSGATTTRVRLALAAIRVPGGGLAFELPTFGLAEALAALPCGAPAEGSAG